MDGGDGAARQRARGMAATAAELPLSAALGDPPPAIGRLGLPGGGWLRHAHWRAEGPPRGTVVALQGRAEFIEKYDAIARPWLARGFQVFSLDWRGQGLSSRFVGEHPPHRQRGHVPDYGVWLADLALFLDRVVRPAAAGPLVLFGHSMGGHLALRHLAETPGHGAAALVLSAPMVDIFSQPRWVPPRLVRWVSRLAVRLGLGAAYAPGQRDYAPERECFATNPLTSDHACWANLHGWCRSNPDLVVAGVTFGWLDATFRSLDRLARPGAAATDLPALVLAPGRDRLVPPASQEALERRLARCVLRRYPDARHEVLLEREEIRRRAWDDIDAFLAAVLPQPAKADADAPA